MIFREIITVVLELKRFLIDSNRRLRGSRIVGILEQLGQNMPRALDLHEQLVPRSSRRPDLPSSQVPPPRGVQADLFKDRQDKPSLLSPSRHRRHCRVYR